jgi:hypothetical protein
MLTTSSPTEKSSMQSEPLTAQARPTAEEIELRAYQIYIERGGADGHGVDDWLQAEHELVEKYANTSRMAKRAVRNFRHNASTRQSRRSPGGNLRPLCADATVSALRIHEPRQQTSIILLGRRHRQSENQLAVVRAAIASRPLAPEYGHAHVS